MPQIDTRKLVAEAAQQRRRNHRFSLEADFAVAETRTVRDPIFGLLWEIRPISYGPYQEAARARSEKSQFTQAIRTEVVAAQMAEAMRGRRRKKKGVGADAIGRRIAERIDWNSVDLQQLAAIEDVATHLVVNVTADGQTKRPLEEIVYTCTSLSCSEGVQATRVSGPHETCPKCGGTTIEERLVPVTYAPEVGVDLFSITGLLPSAQVAALDASLPVVAAEEEEDEEDDEDPEPPAARPLGAALHAWVVAHASHLDGFLAQVIQEGGS